MCSRSLASQPTMNWRGLPARRRQPGPGSRVAAFVVRRPGLRAAWPALSEAITVHAGPAVNVVTSIVTEGVGNK